MKWVLRFIAVSLWGVWSRGDRGQVKWKQRYKNGGSGKIFSFLKVLFSFLRMLTIRSVRLVFVVTVGCLEEVENWNDGPTAAVLVLLHAE